MIYLWERTKIVPCIPLGLANKICHSWPLNIHRSNSSLFEKTIELQFSFISWACLECLQPLLCSLKLCNSSIIHDLNWRQNSSFERNQTPIQMVNQYWIWNLNQLDNQKRKFLNYRGIMRQATGCRILITCIRTLLDILKEGCVKLKSHKVCNTIILRKAKDRKGVFFMLTTDEVIKWWASLEMRSIARDLKKHSPNLLAFKEFKQSNIFQVSHIQAFIRVL